jgi:hypothetical protein
MRFDLSEVCSRAANAEESEERAPARPADHKCNILRVADRDPVARFARTLRPSKHSST